MGTCEKPFFYHITTGKFIKKSAVFHAQIQQKYHEYHIKSVNSQTLNLICVDKSCPAGALLKVTKSSGLITEKGTKTKPNGSKQKLYKFNFGDPNARNLSNFTKLWRDCFCIWNPVTTHSFVNKNIKKIKMIKFISFNCKFSALQHDAIYFLIR